MITNGNGVSLRERLQCPKTDYSNDCTMLNILRTSELIHFKLVSCGLPLWHSGQESVCQCGGHGFDPWAGEDFTCWRAAKAVHNN